MNKILFYNKFIICFSMFRALCTHHRWVKIVLYSIWYHHTCRWPSGAQYKYIKMQFCKSNAAIWYNKTCRFLSQPVHRTATYRCDDTRCCIIQIWPPDDEHIVLETCRGIQLTYYKRRICALSWLIAKIILRCTVSKTSKLNSEQLKQIVKKW